ADENFNNDILPGLLLRKPQLDIVRVQDVGLYGAEDPEILAWAAREGRVLLTHDFATISPLAHKRIMAGQAMPGVFKVKRTLPVAQAIDELLLIAECSHEGEWDGQVRYLPLR
ncbi:MAG TPA: DUF5615 family PIN-like protein, partial [Thermoanaerobaculia bacterium]|nr:DUF5615 family PIN-like protein [Thermoanaerobaculia bacterium]